MPQITVLRHGANSREGDNISRPLTHEGREQAAARRKALGELSFDLVLSSPAKRAHHTAEIVGARTQVQVVDELFPAPDFIKVCVAVLERSGELSPPSAYLAEDGGVARAAGQAAWNAVRSLISEHNAYSVLVVGHNPLINLMGCAAVEFVLGIQTLKLKLFRECEGFSLTLSDSGMLDLQLHLD